MWWLSAAPASADAVLFTILLPFRTLGVESPLPAPGQCRLGGAMPPQANSTMGRSCFIAAQSVLGCAHLVGMCAPSSAHHWLTNLPSTAEGFFFVGWQCKVWSLRFLLPQCSSAFKVFAVRCGTELLLPKVRLLGILQFRH